MAFLLYLTVSVTLLLAPINAQPYTAGCGAALQDIPNPASDSCTAFFRCYQYRQYSVRCPLGQAFDFDRTRCRPETEIDCPLQLQRYQAPGVPSFMRSPAEAREREIEIRVVQVPQATNPNDIRFYQNGRQLRVNGQSTANAQQPAQTVTAPQGTVAFGTQNGQPVFITGHGQGQGQLGQGQGQLGQGQGQLGQGQPTQGQNSQFFFPSAAVQGQAQGQASIPLFVPSAASTGQQNQATVTTTN